MGPLNGHPSRSEQISSLPYIRMIFSLKFTAKEYALQLLTLVTLQGSTVTRLITAMYRAQYYHNHWC